MAARAALGTRYHPRLEIGRQKRGRAFPVGLGWRGWDALCPGAWRHSEAMHGAAPEKAAFWTGKRPSFGDWVTETRQGVSVGWGTAHHF